VATFVGVITALIPQLGYANAAALAKEALATDARIADLIVARGFLSREQIEGLLTPARLTGQ
ncbi:MAG TPA: aspartate ammonia-lyase, partial [Verrucomicrobiota bacterium]|nr:aspartate ammonia-lyase [Verrucomicrobiota bacterium]